MTESDLPPEPELTPAEEAFADALAAHRSVPAAAFRGALDRHLAEHDPGYGTRPPALWRTVGLLLAVALLLLLLGLVQAVG